MSRASAGLARAFVASTIAILVLSVVSSLLGVFRPGHYADPGALLLRTQVEDVVILAIAVPVLAIGLWAAAGGSARRRIVWLGGLAFMTYFWFTRAGMLAINDFFLGYVGLFALSLFTLVGGWRRRTSRPSLAAWTERSRRAFTPGSSSSPPSD